MNNALLHAAPSLKRWVVPCLVICSLLLGAVASAQPAQPTAGSDLWLDTDEARLPAGGERLIVPQAYRTLTVNQDALLALLRQAPPEATTAVGDSAAVITLPLPDGAWGRFSLVESPVMAPELAARFPEIKTYAGQGLDDRTASARLDWTPFGFHAIILSSRGTVYIDPYRRADTAHYISYDTRDFQAPADKRFIESPPLDDGMSATIAALMAAHPQAASGSQLRTYRLAVAATGEYTQFFGGTVALGLAAVVVSVNRVDGVYEREVAVRMVLVANNNLIIYTNAATDPYTNDDGGTMLGQNQTNLDAVIGSANYDVGHVFSTGGGGVAYLGVPCRAGWKAQGVTGSSSPVGDPFDIDYVAHEMGHQFGANHSFNGNAGSCGGGNRNGATAYEPGSGSTIMSYAGICGAQDLQPHSDDYFHVISFDEIIAYTVSGQGNTCPVTTNTGNSPPVPNAGVGGFTIPRQTPFTLTGSGTDANNDPLTFNWEEFDLGAAGAPNNATNPPFFRSWLATASPARTFPRLSDLVNNTTVIGEVLPNTTRALNFRLTARDNRAGGGGVNYAALSFNVTTAAGPFQVTAPNTAVTIQGGTPMNVTWNVASTTAAPVSCPLVNILLSTDGGLTYPVTLASAVANDGAETVTTPNANSSSARVKVACANNIFFDISNVNFTVPACFWADVDCSCNAGSTQIETNDLTLTANAWNAFSNSGVYNRAADINCRASGGCDGSNDIKDVQAAASAWNTACPSAPGN